MSFSARAFLLALVALIGSTAFAAEARVGAQAPPEGDADLLRELAERALVQGGLGVTSFAILPGPRLPSTFPRAELFPGMLPPGLSYDLPVPPGSRIVGTVVFERRRNADIFDVVLDVPTASGDVRQFYEQALTARGWSVPTRTDDLLLFQPSGFVDEAILRFVEELQADLQDDVQSRFRHLCQGPNGPALRIDVLADDGRFQDVRVHSEPPGFCRPDSFEDVVDVPFPVLRLPDGSAILEISESEEGLRFERADRLGSQVDIAAVGATARSSATPSALESAFAAQLGGQGWQRRAGQSGDAFAWSQWSLPGATAVFGYLTVYREPGEQLLVMRFQMRIADPQPPPFLPAGP